MSESPFPELLERELPRVPPPGNGMRVASFFCCAGGFDLGLRSAGFETVFANDIDKYAAKCFEVNLGHSPVVSDIRDIDCKDYPELSSIDLLTGGFPCVTFSMAGKRMGVSDDINGNLYLQMVRQISEVRPRYFVAENVRGMLSSNGGVAIKLILTAFLKMGYKVEYQLVNMAEHGVPQVRQRVLFIGQRIDQYRGGFAYPVKTHRLRKDKHANKCLPIAVSLGDAISGLGEPSESSVTGHKPNDTSIVKKFSTTQRVSMRIDPAKTCVSNGFNSCVWIDGIRRTSVRENARIQSFPDWYVFKDGVQGISDIGNAVPPLYAKQLGEAFIAHDQRKILDVK